MKNWMIDTMINEMEELENTQIETQSAGYSIFEYANINGTYTMNRQEAWDWVNKYYMDLRFFIPDHEDYITANPITDTEAFMVQVMMEYASDIMVEVFCNLNIEDDTIRLTRENLTRIEVELGNLN